MSRSNPWLTISVNDYELHMSDENVLQSQSLNAIMKSQINENSPENAAVFGVTTGNGLEHTENCRKVFAIDINPAYLDLCRTRFKHRKNIDFLQIDIINDDFTFGTADLALCNLIFEYVDPVLFSDKISGILNEGGVLSAIIQENSSSGFVSRSPFTDSFSSLHEIHHDVIDSDLERILKAGGFTLLKKEYYPLPGNKRFIRLDFKK